MRRTSLKGAGIWTLGLLAMAGTACHTTGGLERVSDTARARQTELLKQAGERLGVPIRTETVIQINQAGGTLLTAPAIGMEQIPATRLPQGVDVGVAYVDSPGGRLPRGAYALRAFADVRETGSVEGRIELRNLGGEVVSQFPATFEIGSLRVPPDARGFTQVQVRPTSRFPGRCDSNYETCYCCPNGWIVCTGGLTAWGAQNPQ